MVTDKETTECGGRLFHGVFLVMSIIAFMVFTGPHLWAVVKGMQVLSLKLVGLNAFWSAVFYAVLTALHCSDYQGRCLYCNKNVYSGKRHLFFSWKEKTVNSGSVVLLEKVAHSACHEQAPAERKFKFPE
jgi:hypothetical protein